MAALNDKERKKIFPSLAQVRSQEEYERRLKQYEDSIISAEKATESIRPREEWNDKSCYDTIVEGNKGTVKCLIYCIRELKREWPIYKKEYLDD
jgi:hypothetical protein